MKITLREKRRHAEGSEKNEGLQTKPMLLNLCVALTTQNSDWLIVWIQFFRGHAYFFNCLKSVFFLVRSPVIAYGLKFVKI